MKIHVRKIFNYFLQGLLYVAPFAITIYVIYLIFTFIDGILQSTIENILGFSIPGLGIILMFLFIAFLGYLGQTLMFKPFIILFERLLKRAPLIQTLYTSIKDLISALVGKEKKFNRPVIVKINHLANLEKLGFVTQTDLSRLKVTGKVAVYFPHSYNFSGELFIVPSEFVTPIDLAPSEAMKFIISGGVTDLNLIKPTEEESGL